MYAAVAVPTRTSPLLSICIKRRQTHRSQTVLAIFHCVPVQKFWHHSLPGVCHIDDSKFFFGTVLAHLFLDIAILALPIVQVQKLQLPPAQRIGIIAMFMFGIFVCVASIVVLVLSLSFDPKDDEVPWNIALLFSWATAEVNLAIVSGMFPSPHIHIYNSRTDMTNILQLASPCSDPSTSS